MSHPYLDAPGPIAFAHRGAAEGCAENSAQAVDAAVALGYDYVETDVHATRDGVAVLFHDDDCARLLGRGGVIADYDWADLRGADLIGGGRMARLQDVLADHPHLRLNIDAKTDDVVGPLGDAIAPHLDRVLVASFDMPRVQTLRERFGAALCWSPSSGGVARLWAAGWRAPLLGDAAPAYQVPTHWNGIPLVTKRVLRVARRHGAQVHVWTIDDPVQMTALLDLGAHGLMTDRPRVLRDVMQARGQWPTLR